MSRKLVALLLALVLLPVGLGALAEEQVQSPITGMQARQLADEVLQSGFVQVAQTAELALYLQNDREGIAVKDLRNGMVWFSSVQEWQLYGAKKPNKVWSNNICSLFQLVYAMAENATGDILINAAAALEHTVESEPLENGVALAYFFPELDIGLRLEFILDGDAMDVRIPQVGVSEGTAYYLMAVNLMPFFGATVDADEGYYVYPNGCGELYRFKEKRFRQNALKTYSIPVYSPMLMEEDTFPFHENELMDEAFRQTANSAMLPVYGVKVEDAAFCTVIRQGDADAEIFVSPSGVSVELNRMYTRFTYRKSYGVKGSNVSVAGGSSTSYLAVLIDKEQRTGDRSQRYVFLDGNQADYSGMACAARAVFLDDGRLQSQEKELPGVALDVTMSAIRSQLLYDEYVVMTDFQAAQAFVETLAAADIHPVLTLKGWTPAGAAGYPTGSEAAAALGGGRGMEALAAQCEEAHIPVLVQASLLKMRSGTGGFDVNKEAARDGNRFIYKYSKNGCDYYLMHPDATLHRAEKLQTVLARAGIDGIAYADAGKVLFDAYGDRLYTRKNMAQAFSDMLGQTARQLGYSAAEGGNLYALGGSDLLRGITDTSERFHFGDESVPFWQMIAHGTVAYTGQAMNLFYDETLQRLKDIEYGYTPCFELTDQNVSALKDTDYSLLFNARWQSWYERLIETAREQDGELAKVRGAYMVRHEVLSDTLRRVRYDNGIAVYVNYSDDAAWVDGLRIEGQSYRVQEEAEGND